MMDLDLPITCGFLDAKEKEGNKKRTTDRKSYHREAIQTSPPHTNATYESTRTSESMDLDQMITCGSLDTKGKGKK